MDHIDINEMIINEVQKHTCLYNPGDKDYKDKNLKTKIWNEIGNILGMEGGVVSTKWTSIRDRYQREKKNADKLRSGSGTPSQKKTWSLFKLLWFLDRPAISTCNNINPVREEDLDFSTNITNICNEDIEYENFSESVLCSPPLATETFTATKKKSTVIEDPPGPSSITKGLISRSQSPIISESPQSSRSSTPFPHVIKGSKRKLSDDKFEERLLNVLEKKSSASSAPAPELEDEYRLFCLSLVPVFNRLERKKAGLLKLKILEACQSAEYE